MEVRYFNHYSSNLNRNMEFKVYGSTGKHVIFFPCQGGRFSDFEDNNMPQTRKLHRLLRRLHRQRGLGSRWCRQPVAH